VRGCIGRRINQPGVAGFLAVSIDAPVGHVPSGIEQSGDSGNAGIGMRGIELRRQKRGRDQDAADAIDQSPVTGIEAGLGFRKGDDLARRQFGQRTGLARPAGLDRLSR
jgi:hypothetical protein